MFDARFEKSLGVADSSDRTMQMCAQMVGGFVGAIGQISLTVCPNVFNRIKFGCIAGKTVDMETFIFFQKCFNIHSFMNGAAVPYENHLFSQMPQQIAEKSDNLMTRDVMGMESDIQAKSSATRRDCKAANGRHLFMAVTVTEDWRFTRRSPGLTDNRYEQEPALVEKCQMGPKFLGFFLYGARFCFSIPRWLFRFAAKHASPASDNSSQNCCVIASRLRRGYNLHHILSVSALKSASRSICRLYDLLKQHLATMFFSSWFFVARLIREAVPIGLGSEFLCGLFSGRFETTGQLNLRMLSAFSLHREKFCLNVA